MLTCGLLRMNWLLAMVRSSLDARRGKKRAVDAPTGSTPEPCTARTPFPGFCCWVGKGQTRESAHTGAAARGSFRPGANMRVTIAVNTRPIDLISPAEGGPLGAAADRAAVALVAVGQHDRVVVATGRVRRGRAAGAGGGLAGEHEIVARL